MFWNKVQIILIFLICIKSYVGQFEIIAFMIQPKPFHGFIIVFFSLKPPYKTQSPNPSSNNFGGIGINDNFLIATFTLSLWPRLGHDMGYGTRKVQGMVSTFPLWNGVVWKCKMKAPINVTLRVEGFKEFWIFGSIFGD
jgi:hypothetical protein